MSNTVIRVENLSKRYEIGAKQGISKATIKRARQQLKFRISTGAPWYVCKPEDALPGEDSTGERVMQDVAVL